MRRKLNGRAMSIPGGLAAGGAVSLLVTLLGAAVLAKLVETQSVPQGNIGYGVMLILILSSYLGALVSMSVIKRRKILVAACSGAVYMGVLLGITALFFGGQYQAVVVTTLLIICGSVLALLTGASGFGRKRRAVGRMYSR